MDVQKKLKLALNENRLLILGVQVLFGFQFNGIFQELFVELPYPSRVLEADAALRDKMTFELEGDGRLKATGTIIPGTAEDFAAEIAKRGSYIKTVVLRSPGGSVRDALAMGRLIRQKQFATQVEGGRYCASSCPLVFAGGVERRASSNAAIGVHEVAAVGGDNMSAAASMKNANRFRRSANSICATWV
jgi:hypothetical protein